MSIVMDSAAEVAYNAADGGAGGVAASYFAFREITIRNCPSVHHNYADFGGMFCAMDLPSDLSDHNGTMTITIADSSITDNFAGGSGALLYAVPPLMIELPIAVIDSSSVQQLLELRRLLLCPDQLLR